MIDAILNSASPKRVVHKFSAFSGEIELGMPAKFLYAAIQKDSPQVWVQHCPESTVKVAAEIRIYGTGEPIDEGFEFLGTYLEDNGNYVWHVYAKARQK
jgi:hypothetical protein